MHEVVRVVRVRHIVTHVSSIGQFFQFHIVAVPLAPLLAPVAGCAFSRGSAAEPSGVRARVVPAARRRGSLRRAPGPPGYINPEDAKPRRPPLGGPRRPTSDRCTLHCGCWERPLEVQFWIRKTSPPLSTESRFENRTSSGWPRLQGLNFNLNLPDFAVRAESFAGTSGLYGAQERVRSRLRLGQYQRPFPCHRCAGKVISANAYSM